MYVTSAYDTKSEAVSHLNSFELQSGAWTAQLGVESGGARHSGIFLFHNGNYAGMLQLYILGAALYKDPLPSDWIFGKTIHRSWPQILAATNYTYEKVWPWSVFGICHDYCAAIFLLWNLNPEDVLQASPTGHGWLKVGGNVIGLPGMVFTFPMAATHRGWGAFQRSMQKLTNPKSWNFKLW